MARHEETEDEADAWWWDRAAGILLTVAGLTMQGIFWVMVGFHLFNMKWLGPLADYLEGSVIGRSERPFFAVVMALGLAGHLVALWVMGWRAIGAVSWWVRVGWVLLMTLPLTISIMEVLDRELIANVALDPRTMMLTILMFLPLLSLVLVVWAGRDARRLLTWTVWYMALMCGPVLVALMHAMFGTGSGGAISSGGPGAYRTLVYGFPLAGLVMSVGAWWVFKKRHKRVLAKAMSAAACRGCGYDLSGTFAAEGWTCPECGREAGLEQVARWTAERGPARDQESAA